MMAVQASRQEIVDVLRRTGFAEVADEALRLLPDQSASTTSRISLRHMGLPKISSSAGWVAAHDSPAWRGWWCLTT
jgi:hypothetical protein